MKICVIGLDGAVPEIVFQDERLNNLRRLMDAGLYGVLLGTEPLVPESAWANLTSGQNSGSAGRHSLPELLTVSGKKAIVVDDALDALGQGWDTVHAQLTGQEWDYFQFVDLGLRKIAHKVQRSGSEESDVIAVADYYLAFDEQVGKIMELLDDQTILVVVSAGGLQNESGQNSTQGIFLLAAPNCPIGGDYEGARPLDVAPTLLDLAGYEIPSSMQGRSLVAGMEKRVPTEEDHEKIIYDRLAGLGYV
jgi:predicted AlkP superfamily phosphohydrolase/phosphomutase